MGADLQRTTATPASWSLVHRLTGGVVLVALLSFGAQAWVLMQWLRPLATENATAGAEQAMQLRAALAAVPAVQRAALAGWLSTANAALSQQMPVGLDEEPPPPPPELAALDDILRREGIAVHFQRGDGGDSLVYRLPVGEETWWLQRRLHAPPRALKSTLLVWLGLLGVATASALWVSVRLIARPLGTLASQLSAQRGTLSPLPLNGDASAELQALVRAFNGLVHQVKAAAQARQALLAGVSHDLRTPLARLRLRAETQAEPPLSEALTLDLLALERIVDQFLAYVQGDGEAALGLPAPLAETVRDTVQRYAGADRPVRLQAEEPDLCLPDLAVRRVLSNLIDNALAYGSGAVEVTLRAAPGGAELRVADEGPGMSETDFERALQPFVRLTRARSELGHCGLGLAIVAQVVRQLGGGLRCERDARGRFAVVMLLPA